MTIESVALWHKRARPTPTEQDFNVQLGCHIEEFTEMLEAISTDFNSGKMVELFVLLDELSEGLKTGYINTVFVRRKDFLDSLADQIVTATGAGICIKMDVAGAVNEVNKSNWSKFDHNGQPLFDKNGKVKKGENYKSPNLTGLY